MALLILKNTLIAGRPVKAGTVVHEVSDYDTCLLLQYGLAEVCKEIREQPQPEAPSRQQSAQSSKKIQKTIANKGGKQNGLHKGSKAASNRK